MGCNHSKETEAETPPVIPAPQQPIAAKPTSKYYRDVQLLNWDDFTIENFIQEGGQGKVYVGRENKTSKLFALKFFGYVARHPKLSEIDAEIDLMKDLDGIEGMVQMTGVFMDTQMGRLPNKVVHNEFPVIAMELLEGGELFERIADRQTFSENNIAKIFKGIVLAMDSMHQRRYVHRKCSAAQILLPFFVFLNNAYIDQIYIVSCYGIIPGRNLKS
jgi:serine/threonine protein kinase